MICAGCNEDLPDEKFGRRENRARGRLSRCNPCKNQQKREWRLANEDKHLAQKHRDRLATYGLTVAEYDTLCASQDGRCPICNNTEPGGRYDSWHIDHDHETGKVRGLLCHSCNVAIGSLRDNIANMTRAQVYLESA